MGLRKKRFKDHTLMAKKLKAMIHEPENVKSGPSRMFVRTSLTCLP
jgi:hypothetical protein